MNKNIKTIIAVIAFVLFMAGAVILYNKLSEDYTVPEKVGNDKSQSVADSEDITETEQAEPEKIQAVDFPFYDLDGNEVTLSDFYGKPIVLNFWATWCGYCKLEMPYFETAYKKYGDKVNFIMLNTADSDTAEKAGEFILESGYTFPVYMDKDFGGSYTYGAYSIPLSVFIDADGYIYAGQYGALTEKALEEHILEMLE